MRLYYTFSVIYLIVDVVSNPFLNKTPIISNLCYSADLEGAGARSRLDAVLKGLVEKSENERSEKLLTFEPYLNNVIVYQSN